ncbi:MAG: hypothetical protein ILM98_08135 [Kiritimatiellae bacterium]|nr:hypothetical protein [Kiritimatiellia bacterium]
MNDDNENPVYGETEGEAWSELLVEKPEFADRCPWETLDGGDWSKLLRARPQFSDKCDWEKLDGKDWSLLLKKRPQFARFKPE